jgi:hypothetical protein
MLFGTIDLLNAKQLWIKPDFHKSASTGDGGTNVANRDLPPNVAMPQQFL